MGIRLPRRASLRELFGIDLRSLAAFRVAVGLLLLVDLGDRFRTYRAMYTDDGILSRELLAQLAPHAFSPLHTLSGDAGFIAGLFAAQLVLGLAFTLGLRARATGLLSLFLLLSLHERNNLLNHGADVLHRFLLLWCLFLPVGRAWSLDAWLAGDPRRGTGERITSVGSVALLLQPWWIYLGVTVSKLQYEPWHEGRAIFSVLNKAHYAQPLGEWLVQFPELLKWAGWTTIATEGAFCILLFFPFWTARVRIAVFFGNLFFQLGLWMCLDIGIFQPLAMSAVLPFLPGLFWDRARGHDVTAPVLDVRPRAAMGTWLQQGTCAFLLAVTASSNLATLPVRPPDLPEPFPTLYNRAFLHQRWRMFANSDRTKQGWWLVIGETADGRSWNLLEDRPQLSLARPRYYVKTLPGHHWAMFFDNTLRVENTRVRQTTAEYFCRDWNRRHEGAMTVREVKLVYVDFRHHDPSVAPVSRPVMLAEASCGDGARELAGAERP